MSAARGRPSRSMLVALAAAVLMLGACSEGRPASAAGGVIRVDSSSGLTGAIRGLEPGQRIVLEDGDYGAIRLAGVMAGAQPITITARNPLKARVAGVTIAGSEGIILSGLHLTSDKGPLLFLTEGSRNIIVAGNLLTGTNRNQDPWDDSVRGVRIWDSERVTMAHNLFEDLSVAFSMRGSTGVRFHRNTLRFVREGINVAPSRNSAITANHFHDFHPNYSRGEHPDAIQFWTKPEATGSENIVIARNVMMFGGNRAVQGIFIRSDTERRPAPEPQARHRNFRIEQNVYYGSSAHGITANSIDTTRIANNVVIASPFARTNGAVARSEDGRESRGFPPGIRSRMSTGTLFERNVSTSGMSGEPDSVERNNARIYNPVKRQGEPIERVLAGPITADVPTLDQFVTTNRQLRAKGIGLIEPFPHGADLADQAAALAEAQAVHSAP